MVVSKRVKRAVDRLSVVGNDFFRPRFDQPITLITLITFITLTTGPPSDVFVDSPSIPSQCHTICFVRRISSWQSGRFGRG